MDEDLLEVWKSSRNKVRAKCLDPIPTDENGYVLDNELGAVPDIRKLPRKGGCGIGPDGSSFEQVLDKLDMTALQKQEAKIAAEKKALEERLAKQDAGRETRLLVGKPPRTTRPPRPLQADEKRPSRTSSVEGNR